MKCKKCKYWKNEQSELDYTSLNGICVCPKWEFTGSADADVMLLDRENLSKKFMNVQRFETKPDSAPKTNKSRYCFVTDENYGCVNFVKK